MPLLTVSAASVDRTGTAWANMPFEFGNPMQSEPTGGAQVALFDCWFTASNGTATIVAALVDEDGTAYRWYEGTAVALAGRAGTDGASGAYVGAVSFESSTAPTAYADQKNKIDLMHGGQSEFLDQSGKMKWVYGVTALANGPVSVAVSPANVI